jgi:hypothetical protein
MHLLGKLNNEVRETRGAHIWAMGAVGPFGRVFLKEDMHLWDKYKSKLPKFWYPMLKVPVGTLPLQTDARNCGIFVFLSIIDFVLTQWNRRWRLKDLDNANFSRKDLQSKIESNIKMIVLPPSFGLGTTFRESPSTGDGQFYTKICDLIRMEMCVLIERLHCVYYNAFSSVGKQCSTEVLGCVRPLYYKAMISDDEMSHVYNRLMKDVAWPSIMVTKIVDAGYEDVQKFVFSKEYIFCPIGEEPLLPSFDEIVRLAKGNDFVGQLLSDLTDSEKEELEVIAQEQLLKLKNEFIESEIFAVAIGTGKANDPLIISPIKKKMGKTLPTQALLEKKTNEIRKKETIKSPTTDKIDSSPPPGEKVVTRKPIVNTRVAKVPGSDDDDDPVSDDDDDDCDESKDQKTRAEPTKKRPRRIFIPVEDDVGLEDADPLVGTKAGFDKPLFDKQGKELEIEGKRKRKLTDYLIPIEKLPTPTKKKPMANITEEIKKVGPEPWFIKEPGQTFPIYAQVHMPIGTSYEKFATNQLQHPDEEKPDFSKMNRTASKAWINKLMDRIPDRTTVLKSITKFDKSSNADAYYKYWKDSERLVNDEVELAMLTNSIRLKFNPTPVNGDRSKPGYVRGEYIALVEKEDGTTKKYRVASDWVEENFTPEALSIVQQIEKETKETFKDKNSSRTESGYLSLDSKVVQKRKLQGKLIVDKRQISKLRYLPGKFMRRPNGNMRWHPEMWKGCIIDPKTNEVEFVELSPEWIALNISTEFQNMVKDMRDPDKEGYILIPEGSNHVRDKETYSFLNNSPPAQYWNITKDSSDRRCVIDSVASALFYLGHTRLAGIVAAATSQDLLRGMEFFRDVITNCSTKEERCMFVLVRLKKKLLSSWDTLLDSSRYKLCLLGIASSDGKMDHAICVVGNWVFDSNYEKALPLSKETLDICASSSDRDTHYVKVTRGYLLRER